MILDINNSAHVVAIRLACAYATKYPGEPLDVNGKATALLREIGGRSVCIGHVSSAMKAIFDPSLAASIVRDLLAARGVTTCALDNEADARPCVAIGAYRYYIAWEIWTHDGADPDEEAHAYPDRVPALTLALLDAPNAAATIAALREAGR